MKGGRYHKTTVTWQTIRLSGNTGLAERASKKLKNDELLVLNFTASRLEDFGRYLYLPRLQTTSVLLHAIRDGLELLTWEHDAFAYAENYDESAGRYRGLRSSPRANITEDDTGLLVRPEVARRQIDQEAETDKVKVKERDEDKKEDNRPPKPKRYHGTVILDSARVGRDAGRIADEVVTISSASSDHRYASLWKSRRRCPKGLQTPSCERSR